MTSSKYLGAAPKFVVLRPIMRVNTNNLLFFLIPFLPACSPKYTRYLNKYQFRSPSPEPEYSNLYYWAAHPAKKDPSDSIPKPLKDQYRFDSSVDVFFLHPTTFTDKESPLWNATIDDARINAKTDFGTILFQASAFNEYRLFAPRYRQAHIRSYFTQDTARALEAFEIAYQDIRTAFLYYMEHENNGRPIIIASHSQGTTHALRLLKEFFDGKPLEKKLVSAYLVGMYIPQNQFSHLVICTSPDQANCFCGWRTYQVNFIPSFIEKEKPAGRVTNPISWTTDSIAISRKSNKGAILKNFNKSYSYVAGAQIKKGIIWTPKPKFPGSFLLRAKNYHIGDINLYYFSIRENIRQRVTTYKSGN